MSFKNLLLAYSGEASFASSLSHAVKLADHHQAWLTAAMRNGRPYFERLGGGLPTALRDQLRTAEQQELSEVRARFERAVEEAGLADRSEFIRPEQLGPKLPSEFARHFDLIITGFQPTWPVKNTMRSARIGLRSIVVGRCWLSRKTTTPRCLRIGFLWRGMENALLPARLGTR